MFFATLLIIKGANRGSRFDIDSAHETVIGRSVGCRVRLDDSEVSRQHARISHDGKDFVLKDLNSANGTRVNGHTMTERLLCNGDHIQLGSTVLAFQLSDAESPAVPTAEQIRFVEDSRSLDDLVFAQTVGVDSPHVEAMPNDGGQKGGSICSSMLRKSWSRRFILWKR